jgi:6,7-dimethyl-8-ribityllumazine synthase
MPLSTIDRIEADLNGHDLCIGIVQARFNQPICEALTVACVKELLALGVAQSDIVITSVPGALEIPLTLQKLTETGEFDALIALGAVIRGETYHFELVSNESGAGISRVSLDYGIPIANGVLTCETDEQAHARAQEKGRDCAQVAVEMANLSIGLTSDDEVEDE